MTTRTQIGKRRIAFFEGFMAVFGFGFLEQTESLATPALKPSSLAEHRSRIRNLAKTHWRSVGSYISCATGASNGN